MKSLGELIREHRLKYQLSQSALARLTGVSQAAVAFWEQNKTVPLNSVKVREVLGISIDEWNKAESQGDYLIHVINRHPGLSRLGKETLIRTYQYMMQAERTRYGSKME